MKVANCIVGGTVRTAVETESGIALLPVGSGDALAVLLGDGDPQEGEPVASDALTFLPPVLAPEKILCVGINYRDHASESAITASERPSLFIRFSDSLTSHGEAIVAPANSQKFDFEGELAIVIGRQARHVAEADALDHVVAYTCLAENSVRDFQNHARQVTPGQNFPASGAFGPWLARARDIDSAALTLTTRLNGVVMQEASTSDLIFGVAALVSYVSSFTTLRPGDVIATGTPAGVGALRDPPVWMNPGDTLEVEISGVGHLITPVVAERGA